ncbi:hypothetical protein J6O86_03010 [bacterium]|nr:hypothetical protein [bacterium]
MANKVLETQNKLWGFYGTTLNNYSEEETQQRWNDVFEILLELSGVEPEQIRILLDSRIGRHFADQCYNENDVKQITKECYFGWLAKELFEDETTKKPLETEINKMMFGEKVYNKISKRIDIVIYTYKNKNRVHEDYAMCMRADEKKYRIGMDYIKPVDDMDDEELKAIGLK